MNDGYVGRFGDALRRLTALDAQRGAFAGPQDVGGADTASTFAAAPPAAMEAPALAAGAGPQVPEAPAGALSGGSAVVPGMGAMDESGAAGGATQNGETPTTWEDLHKAMPTKHKNAIADRIESIVGNIKTAYRKATAANGDTPKPHASRAHMAMYLSEIALRAAANRGTSESNGQALAKGVLETNERRDALRQQEEERRRKEAEKKADREEAYRREAEVHTRNRGEEQADTNAKYKHDIELENMRLKAEELRQKGQDTYIAVDNDGNYTLIDKKTGNAVPVTQEVTETTTQGSRGMGTKTTTTKKRVPVKALPKPGSDGLDQDQVLAKIEATAKELRANNKLVRDLRTKFGGDMNKVEDEIKRMAREQVAQDVQSLPGRGTASGKVVKFGDLK